MPKRFTDTDKWMDAWFYSLKPHDKLIWLYCLDACNHAGVLKINVPMMCGMLGFKITIEEIEKVMDDRMAKLEEGKYFIPKFLQFQYPKGLKKSVKAQSSVISTLIQLDLHLSLSELLPKSYLSVCEGLLKGCQTLIETDTSTDTEIDIKKETYKFFLNKGCYIDKKDSEEVEWFVGCFKRFTERFLILCINACKKERSSKGIKERPCRSDLTLMMEKQSRKFSDGVLREPEMNGSKK